MIPRICRCAFALVFVFATSVFAQETRGTIVGHVLDEQGGAMPGVTVTITNVDTNVSATLTTNSTGYYQAPLLLPGNYRVSAELQGFKTSVRSGIILSVAQQSTVDLTLGVGAVSETVTVSGDAPILETGVLTTGQNLDRRSVESLPMFSNMPVLLTRFVTGVNSSAAVPYVAQGFVNRTSSDTSAPGGVGGNEWTIDGATNNGSDRRLASSPNSDMIEEVRIETANFDASFGHGTGLGISMMTRSGTNAMRGTLNYQVPGTTSGTRRGISRSGTTTPTSSRRARAATTRWPIRSRRRTSIRSASRTTWRPPSAARSSGTSCSRS